MVNDKGGAHVHGAVMTMSTVFQRADRGTPPADWMGAFARSSLESEDPASRSAERPAFDE
jgi:hypothetical protein